MVIGSSKAVATTLPSNTPSLTLIQRKIPIILANGSNSAINSHRLWMLILFVKARTKALNSLAFFSHLLSRKSGGCRTKSLWKVFHLLHSYSIVKKSLTITLKMVLGLFSNSIFSVVMSTWHVIQVLSSALRPARSVFRAEFLWSRPQSILL